MITKLEALGYRCLRYVSQEVQPFQILVGPNASGKSTFLDVAAFLGDLVQGGLVSAIEGNPKLSIGMRAPDPKHLVWLRKGTAFELAAEFSIPERRRRALPNGGYARARYEIRVTTEPELGLAAETLWLKPEEDGTPLLRQDDLFPAPPPAPDTLILAPRRQRPQGWKKVVSRSEEPSRVYFTSETTGWNSPNRISPLKSAFASLPEDEERFPVSTWLRQWLTEGVQRVVLSSEVMRRPSPPGRVTAFLPDGSNLPWVVHRLKNKDAARFKHWVEHVRQALPDIDSIGTRERPEDRHRYLVVRFRNGLETPSWLISDGTLRLMALTLLAYAPGICGTYMIEEPENGIHPQAVEIVYQSLSSVYDAQVLLATHSPVVVSMAKAAGILCFARDGEGATDIITGSQHPHLKNWKGQVDLGTLFASGVLG